MPSPRAARTPGSSSSSAPGGTRPAPSGAPGSRARSHDALARERREIVLREAEAPAVDLLVVGAVRRGAGALHAAGSGRELGHDAGHPHRPAAGTGNGDQVLPRPHVLVLE